MRAFGGIPPTLTRVEALVAASDKIGENASKGAAKGAIKGILEMPVDATKRLLSAPGAYFNSDEKKMTE